MRHYCALAGAALVAAGLSGCGGGGGIEEGIPPDVDMTKDYTPAAAVPLITPKQQREAIAATKKAKAETKKAAAASE